MTDGLSMTITMPDLAKIQGRFGDHANILNTELRKAETDGLRALRDEARNEAAQFSSVLPQSVQYEVGAAGLTGIVGSVARTALSIHEGRQPGHAPSYEAVMSWMQRKGIATGAAQRIGTRRRVRFRAGSAAANELRDDAVIIVNQIRAHGTKGLPFIIPAAQASKDNIVRMFGDAVNRAVRRLAGA